MKRKNGFTLIELLAVIVILAIIALIATPIVLNMINSARKSAAKSSALGYIDAIEYNNGFAMLGSDAGVSGYTKVESGDIANINIKLKGKKPESGTVTIDSSGKITEAELCVNGYKVKYENRDVTNVTKGCDGSSEQEEVTCPSSKCVYALPIFNTTTTNSDENGLMTTTFDENQWWYNNGQHCTVVDSSNNYNCKIYANHQQTTLQPTNYKTNYEDVISETGKDYFIAMILDNNKKIDRAFLCYKLNGEVSCFEAGKGVDNMIYDRIILSSTTIKSEFFGMQDGTYKLNDILEQCANYDPNIPNCEGAYSNYEVYEKRLSCGVTSYGFIGCSYDYIEG